MREERKRFSLPASAAGAIWRAGWCIGRRVHRFQTKELTEEQLKTPLIRVGSTRAGGGGRTTVTAALAEVAIRQGKKVALLSYRFRPAFFNSSIQRVDPSKGWRRWSDDALILAEQKGDLFFSNDYFSAWRELSKSGEYDLIIADGGLEDVRLDESHTLLLEVAGDNRPERWSDLLPFGEHRSFIGDHTNGKWAHLILHATSPQQQNRTLSSLEQLLASLEQEEEPLWRGEKRVDLSIAVDRFPEIRGAEALLVTGVGDPWGTKRLLELAGWKLIAFRRGKDHSGEVVSLIEQELGKHCVPLLIAQKDAVKLTPKLLSRGELLPFRFVIGDVEKNFL